LASLVFGELTICRFKFEGLDDSLELIATVLLVGGDGFKNVDHCSGQGDDGVAAQFRIEDIFPLDLVLYRKMEAGQSGEDPLTIPVDLQFEGIGWQRQCLPYSAAIR